MPQQGARVQQCPVPRRPVGRPVAGSVVSGGPWALLGCVSQPTCRLGMVLGFVGGPQATRRLDSFHGPPPGGPEATSNNGSDVGGPRANAGNDVGGPRANAGNEFAGGPEANFSTGPGGPWTSPCLGTPTGGPGANLGNDSDVGGPRANAVVGLAGGPEATPGHGGATGGPRASSVTGNPAGGTRANTASFPESTQSSNCFTSSWLCRAFNTLRCAVSPCLSPPFPPSFVGSRTGDDAGDPAQHKVCLSSASSPCRSPWALGLSMADPPVARRPQLCRGFFGRSFVIFSAVIIHGARRPPVVSRGP